jgi:hypothetical protein
MAILRARLTLSWQSIVVPRRRYLLSWVFLPAVRSAKFEGISWHTLRHSFASRLSIMGSPSRYRRKTDVNATSKWIAFVRP